MNQKSPTETLVNLERELLRILNKGSVKVSRKGDRTLYEVENFDEVELWIETYNRFRSPGNRSTRSIIEDKINGLISDEAKRLGRRTRVTNWKEKNSAL